MSPRTEQDNARTQGELEALARRRGYSNPKWWAMKILQGRAKKAAVARAVTFHGRPICSAPKDPA